MNKVSAPKKKSAEVAAKRRSIRGRNFKLSMLAMPGVLLLLVFHYLPIFGIIMAFKDFNPNLGIFGSPWVGLKNFEFFFTSQDAKRVIGNTVGYGLLFLAVDLVAAVTLALMFYKLRSRRALKVYNTVVILPRFMSSVLVAFVAYLILSPSYGVLNSIIEALGGEAISWYSNAKYWPWILTITHIWQTVGMGSIMYYASLMGVDDNLMEAAALDGANSWQQTVHVLLPHLVPLMVISTILGIGSIFAGDFGLFYQTPKDVGLLYSTTDVISTYTYRALREGAMDKSTAVGLFQSVAGMIMVLITNAIARKVSPESSLF